MLITNQNFVVTFCLQTVYRLSTNILQALCAGNSSAVRRGETRLARRMRAAYFQIALRCSGVPWRAVMEPRRMEAVGIVSLVKRWADNQKQRAQPESHARCA